MKTTKHNKSNHKLISATNLRRNLGRVLSEVDQKDFFIIKGSKIVATLSAAKQKNMTNDKSNTADKLKKYAGAWENTTLDNDAIWVKATQGDSKKTIDLS